MRTLKVNVPEGYEIDKEKSTFENIVFKKKDDVVIRWDKNGSGVEIKADGEHFILSADMPMYYCSWGNAMRHYNEGLFGLLPTVGLPTWKLPTVKQLQVIAKYIDKVNEVIRENGGFEIYGRLWSCEEKDKFWAWNVGMSNGGTYYSDKGYDYYVRSVSAL